MIIDQTVIELDKFSDFVEDHALTTWYVGQRVGAHEDFTNNALWPSGTLGIDSLAIAKCGIRTNLDVSHVSQIFTPRFWIILAVFWLSVTRGSPLCEISVR